eukprot:ctg_1926.g532
MRPHGVREALSCRE